MGPISFKGQRHLVLPSSATLLPWQAVQEALPAVDIDSPEHVAQIPVPLLNCPAGQSVHEVSEPVRPSPFGQTMQAELSLSAGFCTCPSGHVIHVLFSSLKYSLLSHSTQAEVLLSYLWSVYEHTSALGVAGTQAVLSEFETSLPAHATQLEVPFMGPISFKGQRHCVLSAVAILPPWQVVQEVVLVAVAIESPVHAVQTPLLLNCPTGQSVHEVCEPVRS